MKLALTPWAGFKPVLFESVLVVLFTVLVLFLLQLERTKLSSTKFSSGYRSYSDTTVIVLCNVVPD